MIVLQARVIPGWIEFEVATARGVSGQSGYSITITLSYDPA